MGRGGAGSPSPGGEVLGMRATCSVSSIGDRTELIGPLPPAQHASAEGRGVGDERDNDDDEKEEEGYAFFSFIDINCTVRAREGEFLVGSAGEKGSGWLGFSVSFDGCAIERPRVEGEWRALMEALFEEVEAGNEDGHDEVKGSQESSEAQRKRAGGGRVETMRDGKASVMAKL
ncbi:hypothetical protein EPUS_00310 [Endocarpon pusillum Z07020]|uniref:Uncharacterized protein n=1 Tax=Endocarpon pusillum (strain Z07020 / HMAS-L-300199) TaxID=1263415 RepID=U1GDJ2_ENDPU|nr:uncharacterized protein EPUS_00310 [Endocarpon pusillum Z07020]ERF70123.1 hypothetical protein EPUS_00310 [Endocarpon pusillum Z07020]